MKVGHMSRPVTVPFADDSEVTAMYHGLKADYKKLEHDFVTMTKIAALVSSLNCEYQVCI